MVAVLTRAGDRPADPSAFKEQVDAALDAFTQDASYAVAMARAAVVITRKRRVWQARKELREAEARAHAECRTAGQFDCHAASACGTGDCKFAEGEHAALTVAAPGGTNIRPQTCQGRSETYSLEEAVAALADARGRNL